MSTTTVYTERFLAAEAVKARITDTMWSIEEHELPREPDGPLADDYRTLTAEFDAYWDSIKHDEENLLDPFVLGSFLGRFRDNLYHWMSYTSDDEAREDALHWRLEMAGYEHL